MNALTIYDNINNFTIVPSSCTSLTQSKIYNNFSSGKMKSVNTLNKVSDKIFLLEREIADLNLECKLEESDASIPNTKNVNLNKKKEELMKLKSQQKDIIRSEEHTSELQ